MQKSFGLNQRSFIYSIFILWAIVSPKLGENFNSLKQVISIGFACLLTSVLLISFRTKKLGKYVFGFFLFEMIIAFSTVFNHGISIGILFAIYTSIIVFVLMQFDAENMLFAINLIVVPFSFVNFITVVMNLGKSSNDFFFGGKNSISLILVPAMFIVTLNSLFRNEKISKKNFAFVLFCGVSVILSGSATGIIVSVTAIVLWLFAIKRKPNKFLLLGILSSFYLLFLIFGENFFDNTVWIEFTDSMGKDSTLTSRTDIWRLAISLFRNNWLIGNGRGYEFKGTIINEAHNFFLEILVEGGIIAFLVFMYFILNAVKHLKMSDIKHRMVFIAFFAVLLNGLTESNLNNLFVTVILGLMCSFASDAEGQGQKTISTMVNANE